MPRIGKRSPLPVIVSPRGSSACDSPREGAVRAQASFEDQGTTRGLPESPARAEPSVRDARVESRVVLDLGGAGYRRWVEGAAHAASLFDRQPDRGAAFAADVHVVEGRDADR